jgi:hypothetical protein
MKNIIVAGLSCLLLLTQPESFGQKSKPVANLEKTPRGISWQAWEKMNARWQPYSTRISIHKNDGTLIEGQLTWMNDSVLMVQKNLDLPNGLMNTDDYATIPVRDIALLKVRLGGHPYQGLIIGILAGVIPGFVTGAILAQGWTIIPAIVFGAVTAGGGGVAGTFIQKANRKQTFDIKTDELTGRMGRRLKKSALFPDELIGLPVRPGESTLPDFENLVKQSGTMSRAFPDKPFAISIHTTLMTNSVRKRLQNWYMSPLWGPPDPYYEMKVGLQADLSRRIGKRFQAGLLFQLFPGDISSSFFNSNLPEWNVNYSYNHHFKQTTLGVYGGWLLQPTGPYWSTRMETSVQIGVVVSDVYEHFYFSWTEINGTPSGSGLTSYRNGETFVQKHNFQPGAMLRIKSSWYLIPGFSIDTGIEGFLIKRVTFEERTVLPETTYGPAYIQRHTLNFSNLQGFIGLSLHF